MPHISKARRDRITELSFLRAFLALETFLEESFLLYALGQSPPKGKTPRRFVFPPDRRTAEEWLVPEGRSYAKWDAQLVGERAGRFFRNGAPYQLPLRGSQSVLVEARKIRNAIAHDSTSTWLQFEKLVRDKLGSLPPKLTVGSFLSTTVPTSSPPASYLEQYLGRIELVIDTIIPS